MKLIQFVTTEDGGSEFQELDVTFPIAREGADGFTLKSSEPFQSGAVTFIELPSDLDQDWHQAPTRQLVQVLAGTVEVTTTDEQSRRWSAGDLFIAGDTSGRGHKTRVIDGPATVLFIPMPTNALD